MAAQTSLDESRGSSPSTAADVPSQQSVHRDGPEGAFRHEGFELTATRDHEAAAPAIAERSGDRQQASDVRRDGVCDTFTTVVATQPGDARNMRCLWIPAAQTATRFHEPHWKRTMSGAPRSQLESEALREFSARIRAAPGSNLQDLRLFGSKARGDSRPDSDLDVLVVVTDDRVRAEDLAIDIAFDINVANSRPLEPGYCGGAS